MIGLKQLKEGGTYKFVRYGEKVGLDGLGINHRNLVEELAVPETTIRSDLVDMGLVSVKFFGRGIIVSDRSFGYEWPDDEHIEGIRQRTVEIFRECLPETEVWVREERGSLRGP